MVDDWGFGDWYLPCPEEVEDDDACDCLLAGFRAFPYVWRMIDESDREAWSVPSDELLLPWQMRAALLVSAASDGTGRAESDPQREPVALRLMATPCCPSHSPARNFAWKLRPDRSERPSKTAEALAGLWAEELVWGAGRLGKDAAGAASENVAGDGDADCDMDGRDLCSYRSSSNDPVTCKLDMP